jgi:prepilin-type N-terminal cleavage/methylation domain-containing protein
MRNAASDIQRPAPAGFTLVEIAVVLFLMALIAMLVMPYVGGFRTSQLKYEARRLAGRSSFLYDQAGTQKVVLRLTFNLDNSSYSVARMDPHAPAPAFLPDLDNGAGPVILPPHVRIRDVSVANVGTVTRGTISCYFYPEGYVDATLVHLMDVNGTVMTLLLQPLTGRVAILPGDASPGFKRTT